MSEFKMRQFCSLSLKWETHRRRWAVEDVSYQKKITFHCYYVISYTRSHTFFCSYFLDSRVFVVIYFSHSQLSAHDGDFVKLVTLMFFNFVNFFSTEFNKVLKLDFQKKGLEILKIIKEILSHIVHPLILYNDCKKDFRSFSSSSTQKKQS